MRSCGLVEVLRRSHWNELEDTKLSTERKENVTRLDVFSSHGGVK